MDQNKLLKNLRDPVVHWGFLLLIYFVLFRIDSSLTVPFFLYVFEMSQTAAEWLSAGMAVIYLIIAYVSSRLLARSEILLFTIAVSIFLLLNVFSFLGQGVAMELQANDPWKMLDDVELIEEATSTASYRHYISVGLTIVLFACAVLVDFLVHRADEEVKSAKKNLSMSSLFRWFQSKTIILQGEFDRALAKPTSIAEDKVNKRIEKLENIITECKRNEQTLRGEHNYQLQLIELMHQSRIATINSAYAPKKAKSFFKPLKAFFSWKKK